MLSKQIGEAGVEPNFVSNLNCKSSLGGQLFQEWDQHCEKIRLSWKFPAVEKRKLKDHRT